MILQLSRPFPALRIFQYNATELNTTEEETAEKVLDFYTNMYDEVKEENQDNEVVRSEDDSSDADNWDDEDELSNVTPNISAQSSPNNTTAPARTTSTFNLTKANENPRVRPRYEIEYRKRHDYNMGRLNCA